MKKNKLYITILILIVLSILLLVKCSKSTGSIYAPDMAYSTGYETYGEGPGYDSASMLMSHFRTVDGTVSTDNMPMDSIYALEPSVVKSFRYSEFYQNTDEDKARAGQEIKNPFAATEEVLRRGETIYTNQCMVCHGKTGAGDGPLIIREDGTDGAYKSIPPAYADKLPTLQDGEIYHTIVYGKNMMGAYGAHIKPADRWKLIAYIRSLVGGVVAPTGDASMMTDSISTK